MILSILNFIATHFCLCVVEYEFVVLKVGRKFFLLCRVKLAKVWILVSVLGKENRSETEKLYRC